MKITTTVPPLWGKILGVLSDGPLTIDEIAKALELARGEVFPAVMQMRDRGLVESESVEGGERLTTAR